jgi:plastocyanin
MKYIKSISIFLIILSLMFLGCVQKPTGTPTATPVETVATATATPTPSPTPSPTPIITSPIRNTSAYKVFVDEYGGFKMVREINNRPFVYENLTLNIYTGDTVIWVNDISDNTRVTIISEQNLWDNSSVSLRFNNKEFNYTFTQPGTYGVYLKEYRVAHQKIVVNP